ncbi:hypothetical protein BD410DRAFT_787297, partial [Rickenella mellea]
YLVPIAPFFARTISATLINRIILNLREATVRKFSVDESSPGLSEHISVGGINIDLESPTIFFGSWTS